MRKILTDATDDHRRRLQDHIAGLEDRLRRRLRYELGSLGRQSYDVDDVLSSVRRRLDAAVVEGRFRLRSDHELAAYVSGVAKRVTLEVIRRNKRQKRLAQRGARKAIEQGDVFRTHDDREALQPVLNRLDKDDREMVELWARGLSHINIAKAMGISVAAHRSRWQRLCHFDAPKNVALR